MSDTVQHAASTPGTPTSALRAVEAAYDGVSVAKSTQSADLIEQALRHLQTAVDGARDQHVGWGEIGSALGIARGNAYQRYRKRPLPAGSRNFDGRAA